MTKTSGTTSSSGNSSSVVFFGSGPVAAKSLDLLAEEFKIEAVITKPRPEHHKGSVPVLELSEKLGLTTYTPTDKKSLAELFRTKSFDSELGVVIDYGIIIPAEVINHFSLGIVNSHFSLLPKWRGADPISYAILSGDQKTGVSLMVIDEGLDTGKLIAQKSLPLDSTIDTPKLTDKLITLSHELIKEYLPKYIQGLIKPRSQPHPDRATYSQKLKKQDGIIDWTKPATQIDREIRAYLDWPKSRTKIAGRDIIITKAHPSNNIINGSSPGDVHFHFDTKEISVTTAAGSLYIDKLKPAGKKEMTAEAFLAGHKPTPDVQ